jgi:hypothetical protein
LYLSLLECGLTEIEVLPGVHSVLRMGEDAE